MDFDFDDDQHALREAVARWVERGFPFERRLAQARAARLGKGAPEEDLVPEVGQPAAAVGVEHHAVEPEAQADGDDLGEAEEAHGA